MKLVQLEIIKKMLLSRNDLNEEELLLLAEIDFVQSTNTIRIPVHVRVKKTYGFHRLRDNQKSGIRTTEGMYVKKRTSVLRRGEVIHSNNSKNYSHGRIVPNGNCPCCGV